MFKIESLKVCCPLIHNKNNKLIIIFIKFKKIYKNNSDNDDNNNNNNNNNVNVNNNNNNNNNRSVHWRTRFPKQTRKLINRKCCVKDILKKWSRRQR